MTEWAETEQTLANDLRIIAKSFDKYANREERPLRSPTRRPSLAGAC